MVKPQLDGRGTRTQLNTDAGERGHKPTEWSQEAGKVKEKDSPLELPKGTDTMILASETRAGPLTYKVIKGYICVTLSH